ncbi:MAG: hypothetical protein ACYC9N_02970, partial [Thermoanaerobaculia bacterium]
MTLTLGGIFAPMRFLLLWCAILLSALVGGAQGGVTAVGLSVLAMLFVPLYPVFELHAGHP